MRTYTINTSACVKQFANDRAEDLLNDMQAAGSEGARLNVLRDALLDIAGLLSVRSAADGFAIGLLSVLEQGLWIFGHKRNDHYGAVYMHPDGFGIDFDSEQMMITVSREGCPSIHMNLDGNQLIEMGQRLIDVGITNQWEKE